MKGAGHRARAVVLVAVVGISVGCATPSPTTPSPPAPSTSSAPEPATAVLRGYIEDITKATAHRYRLTDDRGNEMDTLKVIAIPEAGGFAGLYHSYRDETFAVHLATSSDLMDWTWRVRLANQASMPTIKVASDGGYVVAWEQEPLNHLKVAHYRSWDDLRNGTASRSFEVPWRLSTCAEGTPNLYSASSTFVDVGFHFYDGCIVDRQARGSTDWTTWTAARQPVLEGAVRIHGVEGGVGDRDVIDFQGATLTMIEAQVVNEDWRTWRVFLHDAATGKAEQLEFRTHAYSTAFTNPTIDEVEIDGRRALVVTLFVPQEGAAGDEAGQLIYYRILEPVAGP